MTLAMFSRSYIVYARCRRFKKQERKSLSSFCLHELSRMFKEIKLILLTGPEWRGRTLEILVSTGLIFQSSKLVVASFVIISLNQVVCRMHNLFCSL